MAQQVYAEMVANVLTVDVETGQAIESGVTLLVLESMKMEIPVVSEAGGVVGEIKVRPGDVVQEGDVLVVLE